MTRGESTVVGFVDKFTKCLDLCLHLLFEIGGGILGLNSQYEYPPALVSAEVIAMVLITLRGRQLSYL